jgi:hypothetical protein
MKTLVIHPKDKSTDFLIPIYMNLKSFPDFDDVTIIRGGVTKDEVRELIKQHERVIMLGHGSPSGLFGVGQFGQSGMIIDHSMVEALSNKPNNIYVWCNADKFMEYFPTLQGFYSGMFISEVGEARMYNIIASQEIINESNDLFAKLVGDHIDLDSKTIATTAQFFYHAPGNEVSAFNNQRMYYR